MATVLFVAACDGENLFSVPGSAGGGATGVDTKPPVVEINSPRGDSLSAKPIGDSVFVSVHVTDDIGVRSVRFSGVAHRGDKSLGTDEVVQRFEDKIVTLSDVQDTTLTRYILPTADSIKETVQIIVEATDTFGNIATDTVEMILGGPDVKLLDLLDGQTVQAGLSLASRVRAQDPLGIVEVRLEVRGAFTATITKSVSPPADSVVLDTVVAVPAGITGTIEVFASARNALDVSGGEGPVVLTVIPAGVRDTIRPRLRHVSRAVARMELQDRISISVTGSDDSQGAGVAAVGYTMRSISPTRGDTLTRSDSAVFSPARTGTLSSAGLQCRFSVSARFARLRDHNVDARRGRELCGLIGCRHLGQSRLWIADDRRDRRPRPGRSEPSRAWWSRGIRRSSPSGARLWTRWSTHSATRS